MIQRGGTLLSFLDVLCSALGATVLLALIFSIAKYPVPQQVRGNFILVELEAPAAARSIGLVVQPPDGPSRAFRTRNSRESDRGATHGESDALRSWTALGSRGENHFYFEVSDPEAGLWLIRPYLADWIPGGGPVALTQLRIWTRNGRLDFETVGSVSDPAYFFAESYPVRID